VNTLKEKVWINIPIKFKDTLTQWSEFFSYESEDDENGKLIVYSLNTDSKEYNNFISFLNKNHIYYYIFRRVYTFTKKEKDNAEILWFWTDDDAKDSYTPNHSDCACNKCGKKIPLITRNKLHVDFKKIRKYDIMSTYNGDIETIVSEKIRQIFIQENVTGIEFESIYQLGKENKVIEGFYHLILKEGIGNVIEPSIIKRQGFCSECGFYDEYICQTIVNFDRSTWEGLDICYTKDWFGGPPRFKRLIISNKLYKILEQNKIKNVYFHPAYFIN
jgi:hypothetical protein